MENIKIFFTWLKKQNLVTKILSIIIFVLISVIVLLTSTGCSSIKTGITGDRVVDKSVRDSIHYSVVVEK